MCDDEYDVVVVGARIAGATLAALLGDAGIRVLLVDRAAFPSPTLSTHFFRGAGLVAVLDHLGVLDRVLALGSPPLDHELHYAAGGAVPTVEPPQEPGALGFCLSVRREPLDDILVRRAAACPTVALAENTRLLGVLTAGDRVNGARLATPDGERSVRARIVVGADGRKSAVAQAVGAATEVEDPPIRAVFHRYVRGFPAPDGSASHGAEFSFLGDEIAYVFPCDAGVTCVALSVSLTDFVQMRTAAECAFREKIEAHRGLADRFVTALADGKQLGCGPESNWMRVPVGPGWALVGDAAIHQDPWTGRGMDLAGTHALYLAEAILSWIHGATSEQTALATYHARRNEQAMPLYRETIELGRDLRRSLPACRPAVCQPRRP
jgi:menaquinone-9 beta-reductase